MGVKPEEINDKWFEEHRIEKAELKFVEACIAYANGRFQDAEKLYIEALPNSCRPHLVWYSLGRLLEKLGRYQEAKKAYLNSIELDESYTYSKLSLIYLYRDKLNDVASAKILFIKTKDFHENYLHEAIFALYEQNWGISAGYWERAFDKMKIEDKLENDLPLSAAVAIKLGYGQNLMALLEATDHHRKLRPFYEAIKALTLNSEDYLRTQVAAEVREVALAMYAYMKKYNDVP
ncbi:MAG: tetratricopeptide repeat protein [Runella slithyformis]|nr:MAG: tetratricopeptide repeat protein [Runella slithyformis]